VVFVWILFQIISSFGAIYMGPSRTRKRSYWYICFYHYVHYLHTRTHARTVFM